jgi:acyl-CoA thioesterase
MSSMNIDPDVLANQVGASMWSRDHATQALDMRLQHIAAGRATITMPVKKHMLNGHQSCHGGYLFTLADSAFAYACNSHNQNTVASACNIDFLAPAFEGDLLEAEAIERSLAGRTGVYDVTVRVQGGKVCALFRGKSYRVNGEVIAGPADIPADKK